MFEVRKNHGESPKHSIYVYIYIYLHKFRVSRTENTVAELLILAILSNKFLQNLLARAMFYLQSLQWFPREKVQCVHRMVSMVSIECFCPEDSMVS